MVYTGTDDRKWSNTLRYEYVCMYSELGGLQFWASPFVGFRNSVRVRQSGQPTDKINTLDTAPI